ncbi:hypothetical protein SERLADRAFT_440153 [Rhizophagus clarus]|uniref:Uncharacterized protein n=1 Tax=Rhizophagus clarus TaxID=94130 RepID=A0A8H3LMW6_9GLOM|nr:hypothetical protein SERLADRAFT_440153 [Rhizophagus clarus]
MMYENILPPHSKRRRDDGINELSKIPKVHIYLWILDGLDYHTLGNMNYECFNCETMDERVNVSTRSPVFATCCTKDKVLLPPLQELLPPLDNLLDRMNSTAHLFK